MGITRNRHPTVRIRQTLGIVIDYADKVCLPLPTYIETGASTEEMVPDTRYLARCVKQIEQLQTNYIALYSFISS
ncbi:hypothetical protein Slin_6452 [Spirosoma linguale DSM 74]|uniref:Uncharacterized protein n=1 Tax=Spirosoma linguale (strain ATCC 33905 / DSM 74 / LMG 10896 / Claus 1) TaxID=504472 RepID=D2QUC7_SPILD|nr:hypothetical protein Slin_6452 [Spirosoma linguale DSM 74]